MFADTVSILIFTNIRGKIKTICSLSETYTENVYKTGYDMMAQYLLQHHALKENEYRILNNLEGGRTQRFVLIQKINFG